MARSSKLFSALTRRGPHRCLRGDLAFAGLPGVLYTPEAGFNLPGVAFGHDWLTDASHYLGTLEHLASWGIVAAAPNTERGVAPSVLNFAVDLGTTLDIVAGVRLGTGKVSVSPAKLGVVGDGFGGSAAVFAAAGLAGAGFAGAGFAGAGFAGTGTDKRSGRQASLKAAAALFPTVTRPAAGRPAQALKVSGLVVGAPDDRQSLRTDAMDLAHSWNGSVLRIVSKGVSSGLAERRFASRVLGLPGSNRRTQRTVRALLTGFLLFHLTGDKAYREFADPDTVFPKTDPPDLTAPPLTTEDQIVALLK